MSDGRPTLRLPDDVWASLITLSQKNKIYLEGNILKVLDAGGSRSYRAYLERAVAVDSEKREKRLQVSKRVQAANAELVKIKDDLELSQEELKEALQKTEGAREEAEAAQAK